MFSNQVTLKSGGYLVINPTEALVSIDVNSGRSTREHNIEDTALKTNLEAAEEVARQLRLRDLAGLIVIDFIDMEEKRNNRAVEKKLNECLKNDRARIQVGRISPFGLLEMSRQRIRTGVLESSSVPCPHCAGTGMVRSTPSVALNVLRAVEETLIRSATHNLAIRTRMEAAFYILNQKRVHLRELETRFGVTISVVADPTLTGLTTYAIDRGEPAVRVETKAPATGIQIDAIAPFDEVEEPEVEFEGEEAEESAEEARSENGREAEGDGNGRRRRRRRRRRGRGSDREAAAQEGREDLEGAESEEEDGEESVSDEEEDEAGEGEAEAAGSGEDEREEDERGPRRRRRGRRGGRGRIREEGSEAGGREADEREPGESPGFLTAESFLELTPADMAAPAPAPTEEPAEAAPEAHRQEPTRTETAFAEAPLEPITPAPTESEPEPVAVVLTPPDPDRPKRAGWWSKAKSVLSGS
jgi:ribonuclease E